MEFKDLQGLVITLMIIGIVLGVGFLLLREFTSTMADTSGTVTNETINFTTGAGTYVTHNGSDGGLFDCYNDFAVTSMFNITAPDVGSVEVLSGNYSYDSVGRIWNISTDMDFVPASYSWRVSYTFEYSNSTACASMEDTVEATQQIQEWLTILVIIFIVGILLFVVYKFVAPSMGGAGAGGGGKFNWKGFGRGGGDSGSAEI